MFKRSADLWLSLGLTFAVVLLWAPRPATADDPLKPYIVLITDVSGSMGNSTGSGPPSCGGTDTRMNHAKCAIQKIAGNYGEMILALARFRQTTTDTNPANGCSMSGGCLSPGDSPNAFQLLVPLLDENQNDILVWVSFTAGTCFVDPLNDPELFDDGMTPLAGSLYGAERYFLGNDPTWSGSPGGDPIRDDPLKDTFLPGGEQCRPYIVILLTDGNETCSGTPSAAAAALLTTTVDSQDYLIETKPIGFGYAPCDSDIEAIAHGGGAVDDGDPDTCEGYYAANETELSLALSQIIGDAIRYELCNDLDDDCDTLVDEDFPLKDAACDDGQPSICLDTGVYVCNASEDGVECQLTGPLTEPGDLTEICNGIDDDCDGEIDELPLDCTGCIGVELCDGKDNDCDGRYDEDLTRPCGTDLGICTVGTETCEEVFSEQPSGNWLPCTGIQPNPPEICNALDDDCNGVVDGLQELCTDMPDPPGNPNVGICHPGIRVCPTDGSLWGPCVGEVQPAASDPCDGLDNDCDTELDEDFVSADCSTACGDGYTVCVDGVIECTSDAFPEPEVCDNVDNDCNGLVDDGDLEDEPDPLDCYDDGRCLPGTLTCLNGNWVCVGGTMPGIEICDCEDNNCNDEIDEGDICAPGASCVACQCAYPCAEGEFPCPLGLICVEILEVGNFCLVDLCYGVECVPDENGDKTECVDGVCVRSCDLVTCPGELVCRGSDGICVPDNCHSFPELCDEGELCVAAECVPDPCYGVECTGEDEYCVEGECVPTCAGVACGEGEECVLGECKPIPCGGECGEGQVCNEETGECEEDPCAEVSCEEGQVCNPQTGECEMDPCLGVECPEEGQICVDGTCYDPDHFAPDAGPGPDRHYVAPGGGGGCATTGGNAPGVALLLLLSLLALRKRKSS